MWCAPLTPSQPLSSQVCRFVVKMSRSDPYSDTIRKGTSPGMWDVAYRAAATSPLQGKSALFSVSFLTNVLQGYAPTLSAKPVLGFAVLPCWGICFGLSRTYTSHASCCTVRPGLLRMAGGLSCVEGSTNALKASSDGESLVTDGSNRISVPSVIAIAFPIFRRGVRDRPSAVLSISGCHFG